MEMSRDKDRKKEESLYMKRSRDNDQKKDAYMNNKMQLQKDFNLTSIHYKKSFHPATSYLSCSPMAYNTTASLYKLTCTDYVNFGKCQDRFGWLSWAKNDSNYLHVKLKVLKKVDNKESGWPKMFHWVRQTSTSWCDWGISWSLQQEISLERKLWSQYWYLQGAKTWMNNQTGSQGSWATGPSEQKHLRDSAAVQCGQAWEFLFSGPIFCNEEGGREV